MVALINYVDDVIADGREFKFVSGYKFALR